MDITLYHTPRTRSLRPRWLLEELQLPYRLHDIDLFGGEGQTREYRKIQPHGAVPAITIDGHTMFESCAMCHWLTDRFPDAQLAPPPDSASRMRYEQWSFYVPGTLEPPAFHILLHSVILPEKKRIPAVVPWASRNYERLLKVLDKELGRHDYLVDERFSSADILMGSTLMWLPEKLNGHAALGDYIARLQARPAYQRAIAVPDDE